MNLEFPTSQSEEIKKLLKEHVFNLEFDGGSSEIVNLPDYEIHPRDFLLFAEEELTNLKTTKSIVNCVSNLKRAIDCQIDIFLYSLNLQTYFKDKRLGIDRKLGFIEKCGLFNKRSLSKINLVRNKLEHHYKTPELEDIEIYYELISAFISVIETATYNSTGVELKINEYIDDDSEKQVGSLSSEFIYKDSSLSIIFNLENELKTYTANCNTNLIELAFFLKIHYLLLNVSQSFHSEYANNQIAKL